MNVNFINKQKLTGKYINLFELFFFMEDNKEKILGFIKEKGPVLPVEVAKHIGSNILMASAYLSELSSNGRVKISNVKVGGGSPLYYISGQEAQLQGFADNLHEKEKRAYDLLLQKRVLKDSEVEPVIRVALRAIKDYAVPLEVNFKGSSTIFWRWYLLSNKDAEEMIRSFFKGRDKGTEKKPIEKETQKRIGEPSEKKKVIKKESADKNVFSGLISNYFNKNKINVLSKEVIRKSEIDFIVQVPSAVGNLEYYCKAKNKKRINENDLASAFAQGQLRKLHVLFLTNGELTKRAKEILQKDFKGMGFMQL